MSASKNLPFKRGEWVFTSAGMEPVKSCYWVGSADSGCYWVRTANTDDYASVVRRASARELRAEAKRLESRANDLRAGADAMDLRKKSGGQASAPEQARAAGTGKGLVMWAQLEAICSELRAAGEPEMAWRLISQISWCEAERKLPGLSAEEIAGAVLGLDSFEEAAALGLPSDFLLNWN